MAENSLYNRGYGFWKITIYSPQTTLGPYEGILHISKDSYYIEDSEESDVILVTVPSPNVAYCENKEV